MATTTKDREQPRHPIQIAARRSGLSADVIRAWERRYSAVRPGRSGTNRRLYSDQDVERLLLLARVTGMGRRIGDVAGLSVDELQTMATADRQAEARAEARIAPGARAKGSHLAACFDSVERLDGAGLESALLDASVDLSLPELLDDLLLPLMRRIGERWSDGTLRVAHEHLATAIVRTFLSGTRNASSTHPGGPEIVVAAPAGQRHEIGALMVSAAATADGWKVTYLGTDLPSAEIAAAARLRETRVVALSIVYPPDDPRLRQEITKLGELLDTTVALIVGGTSAGSYSNELAAAGATVVDDLATLRSELGKIR